MDQIKISNYDAGSKKALIGVLNEVREQWIINGRLNQFWFYASQVGDKLLTEPIILKWLTVLRDNGVLYFFRPSQDYASTTSIILDDYFVRQKGQKKNNTSTKRIIDEAHDWQWYIWESVLFDMPADYYPGIAIDLKCKSLDSIIESLAESMKYIYGKFNKDSLDRYYYGDVILSEVNDSPLRKAVLGELLCRKNHAMTASEVDCLLSDDGTGDKRRRVMSDLKLALRRVSHEIDIKTSKDGHKAGSYMLLVK